MNKDHSLDIFPGKNKFPDNLEVTRNDKGQGIWLMGHGKGAFRYAGSVKQALKFSGKRVVHQSMISIRVETQIW